MHPREALGPVTWQRACRESDVPAERGWPVVVAGVYIAVFRARSGLRAVDNVCRHTGAPLDDGLVEGDCVTCPWHGWRYDLTTGDHLTAFGHRRGLHSYPVRVEDGDVWVELPGER
ncbi:Rieske (2Fe-2S) protein [Acidiferrimicrobium sp. IK]|uniref:Rieske (2Fe-2S) protein n=1 Tax=Acidiferrimicrobium sp. IK TaxID=2871700 RepID=UPI0021CAF03D|nr:Rieske (2Fe-2S) protein [Acidiferrimicrobium sp. IK]MCU4186228.1 Rieske (2Fe-2S) protein [Acidiferrimicrobium sp. IK]